jgi:DNA-binding beta-propeller fold protein YncE
METAKMRSVSLSATAGFVYRREKNEQKTISEINAPASPLVYLRMTAAGGKQFSFAASSDGRAWTNIGEATEGAYLPPWDRAVRVALTAGGAADAMRSSSGCVSHRR